MNTTRYLERIDYHGPLEPTQETLFQLHRAHMLAVPFENLDIHLGRRIAIDQPALFHKIVEQRRGGFCYELNGLFSALLSALGFEVTLLSARVARADGSFGPAFDHLTIMVQLQQRWLADVGFGASFLEPLCMDHPDKQPRDKQFYRVRAETDGWFMQQLEGGAWQTKYVFSLHAQQHSDFSAMCLHHQTSAESSFTQRRVCTRATPEGRITLSDMRLIITQDGRQNEHILTDEAEYQAVLKEYFGITID